METVKQKLTTMFIERGMSETQAELVMAEVVPFLTMNTAEVNGTHKLHPDEEEVYINPYQITWDADSSGYPDILYTLWFCSSKPIALAWIDKNKPMAWFREIFL